MTPLDRLHRAALRAVERQDRAFRTWVRWRKEAAKRARQGRPPDEVQQARNQRKAAAGRWADARATARRAWFKYRTAVDC